MADPLDRTRLGDLVTENGKVLQVIRIDGDTRGLAPLVDGPCDAFCSRVRERGFSHCRHGKAE